MFVAVVALSLVGCQKAVEVSFDGTVPEIEAQGGSVEVALKSNGDWTVSSSAEWLAVTPTSGNGNATLTLTADANTMEPRSAQITASTKDNTAVLTVTQQAPRYYINVTPKEIRCDAEGGEYTIQVSSNINWTVSVPQWITSSVSEGSNDATLTLTISRIEGDFSESRDVEVFIGNLLTRDKVHVVQALDPVLGIEISPSVLEFVCTGETKTVAITTEDAWTASTTAEWIGLDQSEGQGDATVSVTLGENPEFVQRQATVAFVTAGGVQTTLIVRQEASPDPHFLEVSPLSFQFGKDGGEAEINIGCDTDWIIGLACDWLSVSQYEGTGNATVSLIAEPNALMEPRTFAFPVKSGDLCFDVSVTQEAGDEQIYAEFSTDTLFVVFNGGLQHLELTSNTSWTLQGSNWISLITSYGEGDASFDIAVNSNPDLEERIGYVNVIHGGQLLDALVVVQEGKQEILEVDVAEIDARPEGGEYTVHITSNLSWTASVDVDWLHCEPTSGFGPKDLTVTVDAMSGLRPRTGRIKIGGSNGAEVSIIVNQH